MRKFLLLTLFGLAGSINAETVDDEAAIRAVVDEVFQGLRDRDPEIWKRVMRPEGTWFVQRQDADGDWLTQIATTEQRTAELTQDTSFVDESNDAPIVLIHKSIAVFWAPYKVRVDGELVQCGQNSFQLLKDNGEWRMANIMFTAETCKPS